MPTVARCDIRDIPDGLTSGKTELDQSELLYGKKLYKASMRKTACRNLIRKILSEHIDTNYYLFLHI